MHFPECKNVEWRPHLCQNSCFSSFVLAVLLAAGVFLFSGKGDSGNFKLFPRCAACRRRFFLSEKAVLANCTSGNSWMFSEIIGNCDPIPNSRAVCPPLIPLSPYIIHTHTHQLNRYSRTRCGWIYR